MDRVVLIFLVIILILNCITLTSVTTQCYSGWFGSKCQFKCQCVQNKCNSTGQCLVNSKCQRGWFGLGCQYQDLTTLATATVTTTPNLTSWSWLTDNNDTTCNTNQSLQSITVKWNMSYVFTWLQITVKMAVEQSDFSLGLYGDNTTLNCSNKEILNIYNQTFEIHCDVLEVTQLTIGGENVKNLCSLYINGGRNAALRQLASQSSEYTAEPGVNTNASNAVDGDTNPNLYQNSCTHTRPGAPPYPTWTVTFTHQHLITRFILYNRQSYTRERLIHFKLLAFNANNATVFSYTDQSSDFSPTFQVLNTRSNDPVLGVTITGNHTVEIDTTPILTLCEMESYGECPPGTWGLECENCSVNCYNRSCQRDSGLCVKGCHGYSDPPLCALLCSSGKYGLSCSLNCSENCFNQSCDKTTGQCIEGCYGYSDPPMCSVECRESYWGKNCAQPCSPHCNNGTCNKFTSNCDMGCHPGYKSPNCTSECDTGSFGQNCSETCSSYCTDGQCNALSGICVSCRPGFEGYFCSQALSPTEDDVIPLGAIIGPIIAAIVLVVLAVAVVILWRRLCRCKPDQGVENTDVRGKGGRPNENPSVEIPLDGHDNCAYNDTSPAVHQQEKINRSQTGETTTEQYQNQHKDNYDVLQRYTDTVEYVNAETSTQNISSPSPGPQDNEEHVYETFDLTFDLKIKEILN